MSKATFNITDRIKAILFESQLSILSMNFRFNVNDMIYGKKCMTVKDYFNSIITLILLKCKQFVCEKIINILT